MVNQTGVLTLPRKQAAPNGVGIETSAIRCASVTSMKVWIDQDLCTGDGLCEEICPEIFGGHDDGLFYVKEVDWPSIVEDDTGLKDYPIYQMGDGMASVPDRLVNTTIEAAEECPGECIFIEVE